MTERKLQAVPSESPPARKRAPRKAPAKKAPAKAAPRAKSVLQASGGTRRELLVAMRTRIAKSIDDPKTNARDLAALSRRQMEIVREIEQIDAEAAAESGEGGVIAPTTNESWDQSAI